MGWVPLSVDILMHEDGTMRFELANGHVWPKGTAEAAAILDRLDIPADWSTRKASQAYRDAGHKARSETIRSAQKYRQERSLTMRFAGDEHAPRPVDNPPKSAPQTAGRTPPEKRAPIDGAHLEPETVKPLLDAHGAHFGAHRGAPADADGAQCAPLKGAHVPSVPEIQPATDLFDF